MLSGNVAEMATSTPLRDLLHAANLRDGTDGFTAPPKEGVLRKSSPYYGINIKSEYPIYYSN
jgi:hypothetical protein